MKKTYISPEFSLEGLVDEQSMLMVSRYDTDGTETQNGGFLGGREARFSSDWDVEEE